MKTSIAKLLARLLFFMGLLLGLASHFGTDAHAAAVADLVVTRAVSTNVVMAGQVLTYTLTLSNAGPDVATYARLDFEFDGIELTAINATVSQGTVGYDGDYERDARFGVLAAGATATMIVTVVPTEIQTLLDTSYVYSIFDSDPVAANNSVSGSASVTASPGIFELNTSGSSLLENGGSRTFSITRRGGTVGTVSVDFATSNLTATAGADYIATNGTLTFTNGEAAKPLTLFVTDDAIAECNEELLLTLFNPTGGAIIEGRTNATLQIWDDELTFAGAIEAVSLNMTQPPQTADSYSEGPAINADGTIVAFMSTGNNLVTNGNSQFIDNIYVRNRTNHTTKLVSATTNGLPGTFFSYGARVSADGRLVAFHSGEPGLVAGDNNSATDIFLRDIVADTTRLVSVNRTTNGPGNDHSFFPEMSPDGRFIVFSSVSSDLVTNSTSGAYNIFLRDMSHSVPELISVGRNGWGGNSDSFHATVSDDGRYVAFKCASTNLHAGGTNGRSHVYVRDRVAGTNILCSVATNHFTGGNGDSDEVSISGNGQVVVFKSYATDLTRGTNLLWGNIFAYNIASGEVELVSINLGGTGSGNSSSFDPVVSADGRYVAFFSVSTDLVPNFRGEPGQIFLRDLVARTTTLVSANCHGTGGGNIFSYQPRISADGRFVAFESRATDLVPGEFPADTRNIFRRDMLTGITSLASFNRDLTGGGNEDEGGVALGEDNIVLSADGRVVAFHSQASNLVTNDANGRQDIFVWRAPAASPPGTNAFIVSLRMSSGQPTLTVNGSPGTLYLLQRATNLTPPVSWNPIRTTNAPASGWFEFLDREPSPGSAFYRVVRP